MIGVHLIVDGVLQRGVGEDDVRRILSELPALIDMSILSGPHVVKGVPENPGWTGFVIIDKSHISIHTFDEGTALGYLEENLPFERLHHRMLERTE